MTPDYIQTGNYHYQCPRCYGLNVGQARSPFGPIFCMDCKYETSDWKPDCGDNCDAVTATLGNTTWWHCWAAPGKRP